MPELRYRSFELPLKHVFTISRGSVARQETMIVQLSEGGVHGYGEATTNAYYGASIRSMSDALERARPVVEAATARAPETLIAQLALALGENRDASFTLCALDEALHDLWGKLLGRRVYELWGLDARRAPLSNFTIGLDTVPKMVEKLREAPGWPTYKVKLGAGDALQIIRELRKHTRAPFRVDANGAWRADQAIALSHELAPLGVELIEQPLAPDDVQGALRVFEKSALPVIADESCVAESDVDRCQGRFHGVNIKLMKCGGLAPARRMIARARELGMSVMVGCMTESTVGISAIAQLLPLLDYVDMDGAALLAEDIATGVRVERGRRQFADTPGAGVSLLGGPLT